MLNTSCAESQAHSDWQLTRIHSDGGLQTQNHKRERRKNEVNDDEKIKAIPTILVQAMPRTMNDNLSAGTNRAMTKSVPALLQW